MAICTNCMYTHVVGSANCIVPGIVSDVSMDIEPTVRLSNSEPDVKLSKINVFFNNYIENAPIQTSKALGAQLSISVKNSIEKNIVL